VAFVHRLSHTYERHEVLGAQKAAHTLIDFVDFGI
jgi:hypothetical protein